MSPTIEEEELPLGSIFVNAAGMEDEEEEEKVVVKYDEYMRKDGSLLSLALVKKHHSLWGEYIYNAARVISDCIENGVMDVKGKSVLELGAGAGLPSLIAALNGASTVVITDYGTPSDRSLIRAIDININMISPLLTPPACAVTGEGYIWGQAAQPLLEKGGLKEGELFDVVILADCLFNRSQHRQLLSTLTMTLASTGTAYCSFSHHDPHKRLLDLKFMEIAEEFRLTCTFLHEEIRHAYPFSEGDADVLKARSVVYVYAVRHALNILS